MTHPTATEVLALLKAGLARAAAMNEPSSMAVVAAGGNLMGFLRSDEAQFGTIEIAINKACTASAFRMATADLAPDVQPGRELYGIEHTGARPFVPFGGCLPIRRNGKCIGGVGVSGGPVETDVAIAEAMLAAI
jgi:uncharacterized protein GlcG (DUF336 family)